jgi:hypothetical protein
MGTVNIVWRLPENEFERTETNTLKVITSIHKDVIPKFDTRAMRAKFFDKFGKLKDLTPVVKREMYRTLNGDASAAETSQQADIDQRMRDFLDIDDTDVIADLRKNNGNPNATRFDVFWQDLSNYFEEQTLAVHERRHSEFMYLPFALSVQDLVATIVKRLLAGTPIPSCEWVRLQFWPTDATRNAAMKYSGRFDVKFKVQSRQIRGHHDDQAFVLHQLSLIKHFCVKYRVYVDLWWMDDKAIVPIGEPGLPVSTGVRAHNASLVPTAGPELSALDHDFHVCGAIPSVAFKSVIPETATESFFCSVVQATSQ